MGEEKGPGLANGAQQNQATVGNLFPKTTGEAWSVRGTGWITLWDACEDHRRGMVRGTGGSHSRIPVGERVYFGLQFREGTDTVPHVGKMWKQAGKAAGM